MKKMTDNNSNILFSFGIAILLSGVLGLTMLSFFAFIGLPVYLAGIGLILLSKERRKLKLMIIFSSVGTMTAFWVIWWWTRTTDPKTFLIPEDYRGRVYIIHNRTCGKDLDTEDGRLIYEVPSDGVLLVENELETGIIDHKYFGVDKNGNRKELEKMDVRDFNNEWTTSLNPNEPPRDRLGVFHWGRAGTAGMTENGKYEFQEFYVSTYQDLEQGFDFEYNREFDSTITMKLENCRN